MKVLSITKVKSLANCWLHNDELLRSSNNRYFILLDWGSLGHGKLHSDLWIILQITQMCWI